MKNENWPRLVVAALCLTVTMLPTRKTFAQTPTPKIRYHFSLEAGPAVSVTQNSRYRASNGDRLNETDPGSAGNVYMGVEIINGISIWDKFKIGLGAGFQFNVKKAPSLNSNGLSGLLPFYLSVKYIPLAGKVSPYIEQRGGGVFWSGMGITNPVGGLYAGYVGVYLRSPKRLAGSVGLGYQMSHWASRGTTYTQTYGLVIADANHFLSSVSLRGAINF